MKHLQLLLLGAPALVSAKYAEELLRIHARLATDSQGNATQPSIKADAGSREVKSHQLAGVSYKS